MGYCIQTITIERVYFDNYGKETERTKTEETVLVGDNIKEKRGGKKPFDYATYMGSAEWIAKRNLVLRRDGFVCKLCGSAKNLDVHHITYENLGHEKLDELITLCRDCHTHKHSLFVSENMRFDNLEDEEKMLCILLRNNDKLDKFMRIIGFETFSNYKLRSIYEAIMFIYTRNERVTLDSVISELKKTSELDLEDYVKEISRKEITKEDKDRYNEQASKLK